MTFYLCDDQISADQLKETLQTVIENQLKLVKDSGEQQAQVNGEDLSPESPSSQSHISDEPAYDTGVSSSSSVNGDKVECTIENVENKSVDEEEPKKAEIKKPKVILFIYYIKKVILFLSFIILRLNLYKKI